MKLNSLPEAESSTAIAIVGLGCLFPQAQHVGAFWANISKGIDCVSEIPKTHWNPDDLYDADPKRPDYTYAKRGGFLDPIPFYPVEFGISPRDLEAIDTAQLLGLVATQHALIDAGYGPDRTFDRSKVSVIIGVTGTQELVIPLGARLGHPQWRKALREEGLPAAQVDRIVERIGQQYVGWQENSFPGLLGNVVAGRISNRFDLGGTNCVVDAACASSLSAMHLAIMELVAGKSNLAVTGGVDTFNDIFMYMCFSKTPALSKTGDSRPFDRDGDGTILGEGLGILVLKRLDDAKRDGDRIYSIIRGIGSGSDGKGNAVYAPVAKGQLNTLKTAYEVTKIDPATIELVEAHGTGTRVGDATELSALDEMFSNRREDSAWCALGSVKSQFGHTKAAAGAAGLIKATLALHFKVLPPTIKVRQPLEALQKENSPFYLLDQPRPWLSHPEHPRRAGVSSFGFGGSNFHCVLEEASSELTEIAWTSDFDLFTLSSTDGSQLKDALALIGQIQKLSDRYPKALATRSTFHHAHPYRVILLVRRSESISDVVASAMKLLEDSKDLPYATVRNRIWYGRGNASGKLGYLFPGQGSQYPGMMRDLACGFPEFLSELSAGDIAFGKVHGQRLIDRIYPSQGYDPSSSSLNETRLRETFVAQPAIGLLSSAAATLLHRFGITPDLLAGHSYGELTALHHSGVFDQEGFIDLSIERGRLMSEAAKDSQSGMMVVVGSLEQAEKIVEDVPGLTLANRNSPQQFVLSGSRDQLVKAEELARKQQIRVVPLPVSAAFHSPVVASIVLPFRSRIESIKIASPSKPVFGNSDGLPYSGSSEAIRKKLAEQLAQPVEFSKVLGSMYDSGCRTWLEVGPGAVLSRLVEANIQVHDASIVAVALDSSRGKESGWFDLACLLATVAARGHSIDFRAWQPSSRFADFESFYAAKSGFSVPICGANYRDPKTKSMSKPGVLPETSVAQSKPSVASPTKEITTLPTPLKMVTTPVDESTRNSIVMQPTTGQQVKHSPQKIPSIPSSGSRSVNEKDLSTALDWTQQSLLAFQRLQEQTADIHRQFLEHQQTSQQTLLQLLEQQRMLLLGGGNASNAVSYQTIVTPAIPAPVKTAPKAIASTPRQVTAPVQKPIVRAEAKPTLAPQPTVVEKVKAVPVIVAPTTAPIQKEATSSSSPILLEVVAEKTGYPTEMLKLEMALDSDLGIDSIKRVEILSALQERLPNAPVVKPEHLGTLHTLQDVVNYLDAGATTKVPQASTTIEVSAPKVELVPGDKTTYQQVLLDVVSEKTGYPTEMLNLEMAMDSDLGIDSIKRVEILSALQERLPDAPVVKPEHLGTLHTLHDVARYLASDSLLESKKGGRSDGSILPPGATFSGSQNLALISGEKLASDNLDVELRRQQLKLLAWNSDQSNNTAIHFGLPLLVFGDDNQDRAAVIAELNSMGAEIEAFDWTSEIPTKFEEKIGGLIFLLNSACTIDAGIKVLHWVKALQLILKEVAQHLPTIAAMVRMDGAFGLELASSNPHAYAINGILKTIQLEWPWVSARFLDVDAELVLTSEHLRGLFVKGPVELAISKLGYRTPSIETSELDGDLDPILTHSDVIVVTGGGRGVTASTVIELAKSTHATFVLLGRTAILGQEPDWLVTATTEAEIKRALISHGGNGKTPKEIQSETQQILANREIRSTIEQIVANGARALYMHLDVQDSVAVEAACAQIAKEIGPITGIIHGAGVLADRRIEDLTEADYRRVYDTKVTSIQYFLSALPNDCLKTIVLFSSTTARFGRVGQLAYAAANEVLNQLSNQLAKKLPSCRVVAINWGPWDGGMVNASLKRLFESEGIEVIPIDLGAKFLARELTKQASGTQLIALANSVKKAPPRQEIEVSMDALPILDSHRIDGRGVVPFALHQEWIAEHATVAEAGLKLIGLEDVRLFRGIKINANEVIKLRAEVLASTGDQQSRMMTVALRSEGSHQPMLRSRANVKFRSDFPVADSTVSIRLPNGPRTAISMDQIYDQWLFHGPRMHYLASVKSVGEKYLIAETENLARIVWDRYRTDSPLLPLEMLDAAYQLAIVYGFHQLGTGCLPSHIGSYTQFVKTESMPDQIRIVAEFHPAISQILRADFDFYDHSDRLIARMRGLESVLDNSLQAAFRRGTKKAELQEMTS
jgi:acyl transferase domain-containing protein/NAD(P)-dependent dehydrogenase (short-subunit alcohol dehydrogenase family)